MDSPSFSSKIVTRLNEPLRTEVNLAVKKNEVCATLWERARARLPDLHVTSTAFANHLANLLQRHVLTPPGLATADVGDLYLATGCAQGDSTALRIFEETIVAKLPAALRPIGASPQEIDDTLQVLRERILVSNSNTLPKIHDYSGAGRLYSWVRVTAIRTFHNLRRQSTRRREVTIHCDELWENLLPKGDAELEYLKERHRESFHKALGVAVNALTDQQRILLKQHLVDGLSSEQLGNLYKIHRATASRRIIAAQEALLGNTRRELMRALKIGPNELTSFLRLIQSRFDTGLRGLLAGQNQ